MKKELMVTREQSAEFGSKMLLRDLAMMVRKAGAFQCRVIIHRGKQHLDGKNFVEISSLSLGGSEPMTIETWGVDARECLAALCRVAADSAARHEENNRLEMILCLGPGDLNYSQEKE